MDAVKARRDLLWYIGGDFNLIRFSQEREGDVSHGNHMVKFGDLIERWNLIDCPLKGVKFTWSNFHERPSLSRLD